MGFLISVHPSDFTRLVVDGKKNQKNPLQSRKHHYLPTSFYYIIFGGSAILKRYSRQLFLPDSIH